MKNQLFALLENLKSTDIKFVSNPKSSSKNLFENDDEPNFEFNGYECFLKYGNHLHATYDKFKIVCDRFLNATESKMNDKIRELNLMSYELKEFKFIYFPNGMESSLMDRIDRFILHDLDKSEVEKLHSKLLLFFKQQFQTILLIKKYLKHRVKHVKKFFQTQIVGHCSKSDTNSYQPQAILEREHLELFPLEKQVTNLRWGKDKVQLLELLTAIYESDSVRSTTGEKLTKKDFFNLMMWVFNINIKNISSLVNSVKKRKSKEDSYIAELLSVFNDFCD